MFNIHKINKINIFVICFRKKTVFLLFQTFVGKLPLGNMSLLYIVKMGQKNFLFKKQSKSFVEFYKIYYVLTPLQTLTDIHGLWGIKRPKWWFRSKSLTKGQLRNGFVLSTMHSIKKLSNKVSLKNSQATFSEKGYWFNSKGNDQTIQKDLLKPSD